MAGNLFPIDEVSDHFVKNLKIRNVLKPQSSQDDPTLSNASIYSSKGIFQKLPKNESLRWQYYSGTFTSYIAIKPPQIDTKILPVDKDTDSLKPNVFKKLKNLFTRPNKLKKSKSNQTYNKIAPHQTQYDASKRPYCYICSTGKDPIPFKDELSSDYYRLHLRNNTITRKSSGPKENVNKDKSLIYVGDDFIIVKIFSTNYKRGQFLNIFPDFGWRILVNNVLLTKSIKPLDVDHYYDVTFYKESRQIQFSTCLLSLAINISVRSARLGAKFGIIHTTPLIASLFPTIEKVEDEINGTLYPFNVDIGPNMLFTESSKLGLFAPQININTDEVNKFYEALGINDYGWRLHKKSTLARYLQHGCSFKLSKVAPYPNALFSQMQLCEGFISLVDVASYALNMAELIYRLEAWDKGREKFPQSVYEFEIVNKGYNECTIKDINGETYSIIPEEIIMNASTFLQSTFITQSLLLS